MVERVLAHCCGVVWCGVVCGAAAAAGKKVARLADGGEDVEMWWVQRGSLYLGLCLVYLQLKKE
jgi:hypothetical protein